RRALRPHRRRAHRGRRPGFSRGARRGLREGHPHLHPYGGRAQERVMSAQSVVELQSSFAGSELPMLGLLAVMALVPFAVVMLTSFSKMAVVLSLVRSALGTQQAPPTLVLTGLAAVLTAHVMAPVFEEVYRDARSTYDGTLSGEQLVEAVGPTLQPLKAFL